MTVYNDLIAPPFRLKRRSAEDQMRHALEAIRDEAATKPNGGAWAAGVAVLCLGTLPEEDQPSPYGAACEEM